MIGLILTFDRTNQPKFLYPLLARRLNLSALAILFLYRDTQYITRGPDRAAVLRLSRTRKRAKRFLLQRGLRSVVTHRSMQRLLSMVPVVPDEVRSLAIESFKSIPPPPSSPSGPQLDAKTATVSSSMTATATATVTNTTIAPRPTLREALELFMSVSASSYVASEEYPNKVWVQLACDFMLLATLESYLMNGDTGLDPVNACFAYGESEVPIYGNEALDQLFRYDPTPDNQPKRSTEAGTAAGTKATGTNAKDGTENRAAKLKFLKTWETVRTKTLARLVPTSLSSSTTASGPPDASTLVSGTTLGGADGAVDEDEAATKVLYRHMLSVLQGTDVLEFTSSVIDFLVQVVRDMPEPDLCRYDPGRTGLGTTLPSPVLGSLGSTTADAAMDKEREQKEEREKEKSQESGPRVTEQRIGKGVDGVGLPRTVLRAPGMICISHDTTHTEGHSDGRSGGGGSGNGGGSGYTGRGTAHRHGVMNGNASGEAVESMLQERKRPRLA